jgi:hypothetical protein
MSRKQAREGLTRFVPGRLGSIGDGLGEINRSSVFTEPVVSHC